MAPLPGARAQPGLVCELFISAPYLMENPKLLQRCQNKSHCNLPLLQSAPRHVWEWLLLLSSSNPKMIILSEEIGNYQIYIKRTLMYKLCILELAGDFPSESIFRKVHDFHKICMKEKSFISFFRNLFFFFLLDQFSIYFTFVNCSGCLNSFYQGLLQPLQTSFIVQLKWNRYI